MTYAALTIIEQALRLIGLDAHIQRDDPRCGFFDFSRVNHGGGNRELFGCGLHVVVSPLR